MILWCLVSKQPLVAHIGKCLVTHEVQKLGTLALDKESPNETAKVM